MMNKIILLLMSLGFISCGDYWREPKKKVPERERINLTDKISFQDELLVGPLQAGDTLEFQIKGTKLNPTFSGPYVRTYRSSWQKQVCDRECRNCKLLESPLECWSETKTGNCHHQYRDQVEDAPSPYEFPQKIDDINLRIKIGEANFNLGEIINRSNDSITTRLTLTPEMLTTGDEVNLVVLPEASNGQVQIGFIGFAGCAGERDRTFHSGGPTASTIVESRPKIEYETTIILER